VASCGGLIAKAVSSGCPVDVVTVYTKQIAPDTLPPAKRKVAIHDLRKMEDTNALEVLGATPIWLDCPERYLREPWLRSPLRVFRTPTKGRLDEFVHLSTIQQYLVRALKEDPEAHFFAPLGVGNHFDHVELFLACITTAVEKDALHRFTFYEDAYAIGTRMRKRHPVTRRVCWRWWQAPVMSSITWLTISNVMALQARGRPVLEYLPEPYGGLQWSVRTESIQGFEEKKLEALSKYESQVRILGGLSPWAKVLRRYHRFWGGAEPYWRARYGRPAGV
jgi:LmbE family N-acetylglucosaminyl deacetylase